MVWYIVYDDGAYYPYDINNYRFDNTVYSLRNEFIYRYSRNLCDKLKYFLYGDYLDRHFTLSNIDPGVYVVSSKIGKVTVRYKNIFIPIATTVGQNYFRDDIFYGDFKSYIYINYDKIYFLNH